QDVEALKGLTVGWQANGQGFPDTDPCGGCAGGGGPIDPKDVCTGKVPTGCLCKTVDGAYMPGWDMPFTEAGHMGSATDGDSDAVMGLIYLAELTGEREYQEYAVKSIAAFVLEDLGFADPEKNSRPVPAAGDIPASLQTMWLWRGGTCWGGYDTSAEGDADNRNLCINPAYFSPGEWRAFSKFLLKHPDLVPAPYEAAALAAVLDSAIAWGYNTLMRISCGNGLVSNWWSVPDNGWPWKGELKCTNSGTAAGAYYSDAARIPWRVTLDYLWFGDESRADIYDEDGKILGTWGAQEYANRWASGWKELIEAHPDASPGVYPPMSAGATPMRSDQVLPLLSDLEKCSFVPEGFTASPWNGWGAYPVVTCFQVPMSGVDDAVMQEWVEFLGQVGFDACTNKQYFDLGQEVVVSAMLGGVAWLPKSLGGAGPVRPAAVHAPRPTPTPAKAEPTDVVTTPLIVPQSQQVPTSYPPPSTSAAPTTYPEVPLPVPVPQPVPVPLPAPTEEAPSGPWNPFAAIRDAFAALIGRSELPKDVDIATAPEEHHHHALAACVLAGAAAALLAAASALARGCAAGGRRASTQEAAGLLQARPLEDPTIYNYSE
ncbi:unnamed protein product, partial [Prorocentrum cordatum]